MSHHSLKLPYISRLLRHVLEGPDACAAYCWIFIYFLALSEFLCLAFSWHSLCMLSVFSMHVQHICLVLL